MLCPVDTSTSWVPTAAMLAAKAAPGAGAPHGYPRAQLTPQSTWPVVLLTDPYHPVEPLQTFRPVQTRPENSRHWFLPSLTHRIACVQQSWAQACKHTRARRPFTQAPPQHCHPLTPQPRFHVPTLTPPADTVCSCARSCMCVHAHVCPLTHGGAGGPRGARAGGPASLSVPLVTDPRPPLAP